MTKKILIPLATRSAQAEPLGRTHLVRGTYINKILQAGLFPLLVSPFTSESMLEELLKETIGVLLMGGEDVDPAYYGEAMHPKTDLADPDRDSFELKLARICLERRLPILGICRGMQVLAVASGGALIQHIPDLNLPEEHGVGEGAAYDDIITSAGHLLLVEPKSRLSQLITKQSFHVISAHHQAVRTVGPQFLISARSPAGIAEVIEHVDESYFAFAVQSHPEAITGDLDPLLQAFFSACRAFISL